MLSPKLLYDVFKKMGYLFLAGSDSLLKEFCAYVENIPKILSHDAANEGTAIAIAVGHHLASGGLPLVYLQNSGLGNTINPLFH